MRQIVQKQNLPKIILVSSLVIFTSIFSINAASAQYMRGGGYVYEPYDEDPYYQERYTRRAPRSSVEILEEGPIRRIERPKRKITSEIVESEPRSKPINKLQKQAAPTPPAKPKVFSEFETSKRPELPKGIVEKPIFGKYAPQEVVFEFKPNASPQSIDQIIATNKLERIASWKFKLTNSIIFQYRIKDGRSIEAVMAALQQSPDILSAQPNFMYSLQQTAPLKQVNPSAQYALNVMNAKEAQSSSKGAGVIIANINALSSEISSIAPEAKIISQAAPAPQQNATSFDLLRYIDWSFENKARIVNIGFSGAYDEDVSRMIEAAKLQKMIIIAAAPNESANDSYPASDRNVIAVAAIDADNKVYGNPIKPSAAYVPIFVAPGVNIMTAASITASGSALAASHVSGVVALMLQLKPELNTDDVRKLLAQSATTLKLSDGNELKSVDALAAVKAVEGK
jgi:subtilisin family serine protease